MTSSGFYKVRWPVSGRDSTSPRQVSCRQSARRGQTGPSAKPSAAVHGLCRLRTVTCVSEPRPETATAQPAPRGHGRRVPRSVWRIRVYETRNRCEKGGKNARLYFPNEEERL